MDLIRAAGNQAQSHSRSPLVWALAVMALVFMVFVGGTYSGTATFGLRVVTQAVVLVSLTCWLVAMIRNPWWQPRSLLVLPGLVALGGIAVATALSAEPRLSVGGLATAAVSLSAYLLIHRMATHPWYRPRLAMLIVLMALAVGIWYLAEVFATWLEWWRTVGHLALPPARPAWAGLTLGSPNLVATLTLLLTPPAMAVTATRGPYGRGTLGVTGVLALLAVTTIGLSGSRGGALGFAGGVAVGGALLLARARHVSRRTVLVLIALSIPAGLAVLVVGVSRISQGGEDLRIELWRTAIAIFSARPLTGGGPDTWALLKLGEAQPFVSTVVVYHAHDVYVMTLAELGVLGTAAAAVLVVATMRMLVARARNDDLQVSALGIATIAALTGVALQSIVDVVTNLSGIVLVIALVVAYAEGAARGAAARRSDNTVPQFAPWSRRRNAGALLGTGALMLLGLGFVRSDLALASAARGGDALLQGNAAEAIDYFESASDLDPVPLYEAERIVAQAFAHDPRLSGSQLAQLVATDGLAHYRILWAYWLVAHEDAQGAANAARSAIERGWPDPGVMLNASRIGELVGDEDLARHGLVLAAALAPTSLGDPYWHATGRALSFSDLVSQAASVARDRVGNTEQARIRAEALVLGLGGRPAAATEVMSGLSVHDRVLLAAVISSIEDKDAAIAILQHLLASNPLDWEAAAWLGRLEEEAGDASPATRYQRWATIDQGDSAPQAASIPRHVDGPSGLPQFRMSGQYPEAVYGQGGSELLFGPNSVTLVP